MLKRGWAGCEGALLTRLCRLSMWENDEATWHRERVSQIRSHHHSV